MKNIIRQPKWKEVEYSRSQIIDAGKIIRKKDSSEEEKRRAIEVIDNWREAHAFPLHVIYMHLRRMAEKDSSVIVAERLKRLESITNKLIREQSMNLWTMQDLGGCRVIVNSIDDVYEYSTNYEKSKKRHIQKKVYDYIKYPKLSGYRSLHVVYEYHSDRSDKYNKNMLIEIQYRTHLQHLWATSVETMGFFRQEAIKSGQGSESVKRFFLLVSALFAYKEQQVLPSNVPQNINEIIAEIKLLNKKYKYLEFLSGIRVAVEKQEHLLKDVKQEHQLKNIKSTGYFILILNYATCKLNIIQFNSSKIDEAAEVYNEIEKTNRNAHNDTVLVRVSSFKSLKSAYPNYFSDIGEFINIVRAYLD